MPCEKKGIPCFIEASVTDCNRISELDQRISESGVIMAPSCTMRFYPGPLKVKELISQGVLGRGPEHKLSNRAIFAGLAPLGRYF